MLTFSVTGSINLRPTGQSTENSEWRKLNLMGIKLETQLQVNCS